MKRLMALAMAAAVVACASSAPLPITVGQPFGYGRSGCEGALITNDSGDAIYPCGLWKSFVLVQGGIVRTVLPKREFVEERAAFECGTIAHLPAGSSEYGLCLVDRGRAFEDYLAGRQFAGDLQRQQERQERQAQQQDGLNDLALGLALMQAGQPRWLDTTPTTPSFESRRDVQPQQVGCRRTGEYRQGLNKVCTYQCARGPAAITINAASICPMQPN